MFKASSEKKRDRGTLGARLWVLVPDLLLGSCTTLDSHLFAVLRFPPLDNRHAHLTSGAVRASETGHTSRRKAAAADQVASVHLGPKDTATCNSKKTGGGGAMQTEVLEG